MTTPRAIFSAITLCSLLVGSPLLASTLDAPPGWFAGDLHVHGPDECLGVFPPASHPAGDGMPPDLNVSSALLWGGGGFFEQNKADYFSGSDDPVSTATQIVHYDLELSGFLIADRMGHIAALGLENLDFPQATYLGPIYDWAHAQGAIVGSLHSQAWTSTPTQFPPLDFCCVPFELPVDIVFGRVDYLSTTRDRSSSTGASSGIRSSTAVSARAWRQRPTPGACFRSAAIERMPGSTAP